MSAAGGPTCWCGLECHRVLCIAPRLRAVWLQVLRGDGARHYPNRVIVAARNRDRQDMRTGRGQHLEVPMPRAVIQTAHEVHADRRQRERKGIQRHAKTGAGRLKVGFPERPQTKKQAACSLGGVRRKISTSAGAK